MIKLRPYVPSNRIAVRDSIDEDISDDIDDDVFIKDARSAKLCEEKRALMAPRRKNGKLHSSTPIMKKHRRCSRFCEPFCYSLAALTVLCALISLAALILTLFPLPLQRIKVWWRQDGLYALNGAGGLAAGSYGASLGSEFVPCTQINVQKLWTRTFPRMNSESPVRATDLNGDGVKDIIFGYGVDDNIQYEGIPLPRCKSAQQGDDVPCEGGVIAINGRTGDLLWQSWSVANVFSLLCTLDIDQDGFTDCVAAGRLGMIFAINGRNGNSIWEFRELVVETNWPIVMDLYTINVVRDLNGDVVPDIIAAHLEEREDSKAGHIKLISGKNGKVIRTIPTPYREEVFVPPQLLTREDGTELLLIIAGGQNTPGGVYSFRLLSLMEFTSEKEFTPLYKRNDSGLMVPAVLTDITGDHVADVVVSAFNGTVYAFDGRNYSMLWNYTFPASESVSAIVPGHFNHDNVTDFMVKYNTGPGFPVYYYSQTSILDGRTGQPLLDATMTDSGGSNSLLGGVSISQSFGGDFFLHWQMQCRDKINDKEAYEFVPDSDIILQARADTCRLRYNESTVLKLYAIARHIEPPGAVIFSTDDLEVKLNRTIRPAAKQSPLKHPKLLKKLLANREQLQRKAVASEEQMKTEQSTPTLGKLPNHHRNKQLEREMMQALLPNNPQQVPANNYGYMDTGGDIVGGYRDNNFKELREFGFEPEAAGVIPPEYDYDNEAAAAQNERPIHLRSKYPLNRDVRSDAAVVTQMPTPQPSVSNQQQQPITLGGAPLTLWDLELEKERQEALQEAAAVDQQKRRRRRRETSTATENDNESTTNTPTQSEDGSSSDWYLASISSTGVLLKSITNVTSTLDFAFVLNIRESETYPPLFMPQDLNCVDEKISAYKSYTVDNLRILRKQFLKQCLSERLVENTPVTPKYESQLIVTRIGITCSCRSLQPGEVCSELDDIDAQRWTGFMGNDGNGFYAN